MKYQILPLVNGGSIRPPSPSRWEFSHLFREQFLFCFFLLNQNVFLFGFFSFFRPLFQTEVSRKTMNLFSVAAPHQNFSYRIA